MTCIYYDTQICLTRFQLCEICGEKEKTKKIHKGILKQSSLEKCGWGGREAQWEATTHISSLFTSIYLYIYYSSACMSLVNVCGINMQLLVHRIGPYSPWFFDKRYTATKNKQVSGVQHGYEDIKMLFCPVQAWITQHQKLARSGEERKNCMSTTTQKLLKAVLVTLSIVHRSTESLDRTSNKCNGYNCLQEKLGWKEERQLVSSMSSQSYVRKLILLSRQLSFF